MVYLLSLGKKFVLKNWEPANLKLFRVRALTQMERKTTLAVLPGVITRLKKTLWFTVSALALINCGYQFVFSGKTFLKWLIKIKIVMKSIARSWSSNWIHIYWMSASSSHPKTDKLLHTYPFLLLYLWNHRFEISSKWGSCRCFKYLCMACKLSGTASSVTKWFEKFHPKLPNSI